MIEPPESPPRAERPNSPAPLRPQPRPSVPDFWLGLFGLRKAAPGTPPQPLTRLQWDIIQGLLYAIGIFGLVTPATMVVYLALVPLYLLVMRARRYDESRKDTEGAGEATAPHSITPESQGLSAIQTGGFEEVRLAARLSSLEDTEEELLALREESERMLMPDLTAELDRDLADVRALKEGLKTRERQELRARSAQVRSYLRDLKGEHPADEDDQLKL